MQPKNPLFLVLGLVLCGTNLSLSHAETPQAELYTMGPGEELFTRFGHAALCVTTESWTPALCFNYGTTDFSRPVGLTWDVLRGRAEFFVSVQRLDDMLIAFQSQDRTIYRQTLPLSNEQVLRLARELNEDAQPENRAYLYDHFLDNCSTKPRDLIDGVTGGVLATMNRSENPTYRELVDEGLGHRWLLMFFSDLLLGRRLDHVTTPYEAMFSPRALRGAVAERFGSAPVTVYARQAPLPPVDAEAARLWTWLLMIGFAATTSAAIAWGSIRLATAARVFVGLTLGALGTLTLFMAIASPEPGIRYNENLLVFLATDFLLVTGRWKLISWNARLRVVELGLVGVLAAAGVLIQPLWPFWCAALAPLVAVACKFP
jgi:hypothetical protein